MRPAAVLTVVVKSDTKAGEAGLMSFNGQLVASSKQGGAWNAVAKQQKKNLSDLGRLAKRGAAVGFAAVGYAVYDTVKAGADFEQQMARVKGVSNATGKQMDMLTKVAIRLGQKTKFSASDAAEGMYELASAGFTARQSAKALPGTLALAAASGIDLASAAEISSNALRGFGLRVDQSRHVADVLSESVNRSSAKMGDLQYSLKYIGPVAKATGQSFESMIAAVSIMANAGIKGSNSGVALRQSLLRLVHPVGEAADGLESIGLSAEDLQGKNGLLPLPELVGKLQKGLEGMTKAQKAATLEQIFGKASTAAMLTVIDKGPAKLQALTDSFVHSGGAAQKAAKTMNTTVAGSWEQLTGSIETAQIQLFEAFKGPLRNALMGATKIVNTEGRYFQERLEAVMGTPQFKQADTIHKAQMLIGALGDTWEHSGLGPKIEDSLIKAFNYAVPKVAAGAGHLSIEAAKGFLKSFVSSDGLGQLVLGGWLISKIGGKAAFVGIGRSLGGFIGLGVAEGTAAGVAGTTAAGGAGAAVAGGAAAGGLVSKLKGIKWGRVGGLGLGLVVADGVMSELTRSLSGSATTPVIDELKRKAGVYDDPGPLNALSRLVGSGGDKEAEDLKNSLEAISGLHRQITAEEAKQTRHLIDINDLSDQQRQEALGILRAKFPAKVREQFNDGLDQLKSGAVVRMADINKLMAKGANLAKKAWTKPSDYRWAMGENMDAAVSAIRSGMKAGTIEVDKGRAMIQNLLRQKKLVTGSDPLGIAAEFAKGWAKTKTINAAQIKNVIADMRKMPPKAQEIAQDAMLRQARALQQKGALSKQALSRLRSALVTEFGVTAKAGVAKFSKGMSAMGTVWSKLDSAIGGALGSIGQTIQSALKKWGVTDAAAAPFKFAGNVGGQLKGVFDDLRNFVGNQQGGFIARQAGGIVPGHGTGDKVPKMLPSGSFVMNKKATKAHGFQKGGHVATMLEPGERWFHPDEVAKIGRGRLEVANSMVPRFANGGVVIKGWPGAALDYANAGVDKVENAAVRYARRKARAKAAREAAASGGVGGYTGPPADFRRLGNNSYVDSHTLAVAAYVAKKFGLQITDGYRDTATALKYPSGLGTLHHDGSPSNPGAVDVAGPMGGMQAALAWVGQHVAGLQELQIDNVAGWNLHMGFFQKGGSVGRPRFEHDTAPKRTVPTSSAKPSMTNWGPWAGTSIDRVWPESSGLGSGPSLPFRVAAALTEWFGLPGKTMAAVGFNETHREPGMHAPDPPGYSNSWLAIHQNSNPQYDTTKLRNPIYAAAAARELSGGHPTGSMWHAGSAPYGWNDHWGGEPWKVAKSLGGGGGGSSGPSKGYLAMIARIKQLNAWDVPYKLSHVGFSQHPDFLDCSAAVSDALHAGGVLDEELVSGDLAKWGSAGAGKMATVFANAGHAFMRVKWGGKDRYWGTSVGDSGSGGLGFHPTPSQSYLDGFTARHSPALDAGGSGGGLTDAQKQARENARRKKNREATLVKLQNDVEKASSPAKKKSALWQLISKYAAWGVFGPTTVNSGGFGPDKNVDPQGQRHHFLDAVRDAASKANPTQATPILARLAKWAASALDITGVEDSPDALTAAYEAARKTATAVGSKRRKRRRKRQLAKTATAGLPNALQKQIAAKDNSIADLDYWIEGAEDLAGRSWSESGSDTGPGELDEQIKLNTRLLTQLQKKRDLITTTTAWLQLHEQGIEQSIRAAKPTDSKTHWKYQAFLKNQSTTKAALVNMGTKMTELVGRDGKGGRIRDVTYQLFDLGYEGSGSNISIDDLRSVIEAAKYGVYDAKFAGMFKDGGSIGLGKWGIAGEAGPEIVHGPATVLPMASNPSAASPNIETKIYLDGLDVVIEYYIEKQLMKRERKALLAGRAGR